MRNRILLAMAMLPSVMATICVADEESPTTKGAVFWELFLEELPAELDNLHLT
jgi:hypothetical protein